MRALDLFCGAGGAGMGYHRAGFEVVGVDLAAQPHYPFEFHQGDALEFLTEHGHGFDLIHASPPCQRFSTMTGRWGRQGEHPDLIVVIRGGLLRLGLPYVIENVVGAPLKNPVVLCGSMFDLSDSQGRQLRRHRGFETSFPVTVPECRHSGPTVGVYGSTGGSSRRDGVTFARKADRMWAMGIDWMTMKELSEAIPPDYTNFIGVSALQALVGAT